jgi:hypothetical protein
MAEASTSDPKRCSAHRRDGQPCAAAPLPDSAYCFAHDPQRAEQRDQARRRGGANSAKVVRLRGLMPPRLVPIFDELEAALGEVHAGELDPKRAAAMAGLARAMVAVLTAGELEERVRQIESRDADTRQRDTA